MASVHAARPGGDTHPGYMLLLLAHTFALIAPAPHIRVRTPAARYFSAFPIRRNRISMGAKAKKKGKSSFEEYTIQGIGTDIFPLPAQRDAIQVHKKYRGSGCSPAKAPPGLVPPLVDINYPGLKLVHLDPPVFVVDDFFSSDECDTYRALCDDGENTHQLAQSATFSSVTSGARTSTTWFARYQAVPFLLARAAALLQSPIDTFEEPQLVRYQPGERFTWHYDAVPPTMLNNGGQRLATLLVYLNDVPSGGRTAFRDLRVGGSDETGRPLRLDVEPKKGRALLFFPSAADGKPDDRTLHAGEPAKSDKWVAQLWLHERQYKPSTPEGTCQSSGDEAARSLAESLGLHVPTLGTRP